MLSLIIGYVIKENIDKFSKNYNLLTLYIKLYLLILLLFNITLYTLGRIH